jgi:coproporphyrinogen III oxidase-like Fe-S oxidoreductase
MSDIVEVLKPIGKEVGKMAIDKGTDFVKRKALEAIGSGAKKGRSARAEIVKKVMKEKGMKMIEASKYVKAHNLY